MDDRTAQDVRTARAFERWLENLMREMDDMPQAIVPTPKRRNIRRAARHIASQYLACS